MNEESLNPTPLQFDEQTPPINGSIHDVRRIIETQGQVPRSQEDLAAIVEAPLLAAATTLYLRGIQTTSSTANPENIDGLGHGELAINYDSLSEENKLIAGDLAQQSQDRKLEQGRLSTPIVNDAGDLTIVIEISLAGTIEEMSARASAVAGLFQLQPMNWAPRYTFDELLDDYQVPPENRDEYKPEDFTEDYYLSPEDGLFYLSADHAQRALHPSEQ